MAETKMHMPGGFGGLMRYDEEYVSRFMLSPKHVIGFIIAVIALVLVMKIFFPINTIEPLNVGSVPQLILSLLK